MLGWGLLVKPVTAPGTTHLDVQLPAGARWYDAVTGAAVQAAKSRTHRVQVGGRGGGREKESEVCIGGGVCGTANARMFPLHDAPEPLFPHPVPRHCILGALGSRLGAAAAGQGSTTTL